MSTSIDQHLRAYHIFSVWANWSTTHEPQLIAALLIIPSIFLPTVVYEKAILPFPVVWLLSWPCCPTSELPGASVSPGPIAFLLPICSSNPEECVKVVCVHFGLHVIVDSLVCNWGKVPILVFAEQLSICPGFPCGVCEVCGAWPQVALVLHSLPAWRACWCWWNTLVFLFSLVCLNVGEYETEVEKFRWQPHSCTSITYRQIRALIRIERSCVTQLSIAKQFSHNCQLLNIVTQLSVLGLNKDRFQLILDNANCVT